MAETPKPLTADELAQSPDYVLEYTGRESGIAYYVRYVDPEDRYPDAPRENEAMVAGGGRTLYFYIALKDGEMVVPPAEDVSELTQIVVSKLENISVEESDESGKGRHLR